MLAQYPPSPSLARPKNPRQLLLLRISQHGLSFCSAQFPGLAPDLIEIYTQQLQTRIQVERLSGIASHHPWGLTWVDRSRRHCRRKRERCHRLDTNIRKRPAMEVKLHYLWPVMQRYIRRGPRSHFARRHAVE